MADANSSTNKTKYDVLVFPSKDQQGIFSQPKVIHCQSLDEAKSEFENNRSWISWKELDGYFYGYPFPIVGTVSFYVDQPLVIIVPLSERR